MRSGGTSRQDKDEQGEWAKGDETRPIKGDQGRSRATHQEQRAKGNAPRACPALGTLSELARPHPARRLSLTRPLSLPRPLSLSGPLFLTLPGFCPCSGGPVRLRHDNRGRAAVQGWRKDPGHLQGHGRRPVVGRAVGVWQGRPVPTRLRRRDAGRGTGPRTRCCRPQAAGGRGSEATSGGRRPSRCRCHRRPGQGRHHPQRPAQDCGQAGQARCA